MKLATVNPELNIDLERVLSKDVSFLYKLRNYTSYDLIYGKEYESVLSLLYRFFIQEVEVLEFSDLVLG